MQAEGNQIHATHLRGQIMNAEGRLMDELTTAFQAPVPLALTDEISSAIVPISQPSAAASASAAASSASASAAVTDAEKSISSYSDDQLVNMSRDFLIYQLATRNNFWTDDLLKTANNVVLVGMIRDHDRLVKKPRETLITELARRNIIYTASALQRTNRLEMTRRIMQDNLETLDEV
jgi:hypothetical protein